MTMIFIRSSVDIDNLRLEEKPWNSPRQLSSACLPYRKMGSGLRYRFLRLLTILGFLVLNVSGYQLISLNTDEDLTSDGPWSISGDCEYFDTSIGNICPDSDNGNTTTEEEGFWASCSKKMCSITYTAKSIEEIPNGIHFRIYALRHSNLTLKTESFETHIAIHTIGWGEYTIQGNFKDDLTLTLVANEGSQIIIFDEIMVEISSNIPTTDLSSTETTSPPDSTSETLSTREPWESTNKPTALTTLSSNPSTETSISPEVTESISPETSTLSTTTLSELPTHETTKSITDTSTYTTENFTPTTTFPTRTDRLDTVADLTDDNPWSVDCQYGATLKELSENCPNVKQSDSENRTGYWTPCNKMSCQVIFKAKDELETIWANQLRQISFRAFISNYSQLSITVDNGVALGFPGTGTWTDIQFLDIKEATIITITADNSGPRFVIIDEIRVKTTGGSIIPTTTTPATITTSKPINHEAQSELYLLLILIAVGLVIVLMTLLILFTCLRRICCCKKKRSTTEEELIDDSLEMKYDEFRTTVVKLPVPPVTPPPGYAHQEYSNRGLDLQSSPRHLSTFKPLPLEPPVAQPVISESSPYRKGQIYYSGTPGKNRGTNLNGDQEVPAPVLPRLVRADRQYGLY